MIGSEKSEFRLTLTSRFDLGFPFDITNSCTRIIRMLEFFEIIIALLILILTTTFTCHLLGVKDTNYKYASLEGLRGLAAALVAIFHLYWRAGGSSDRYWSIDYLASSELRRAILLIGELPVGAFFMLSGFLFFRKALTENYFNIKDFFISRILRIYPAVIASLAIIYCATAVMNSGIFTTPLSWVITALPFIREYQGSLVNTFPINITNSGVLWTLVWEIRLYLCIPFLYILMRFTPYKKMVVIIAMIGVIILDKTRMIESSIAGYLMYFLAGFLVAATKDIEIKRNNIICILLLIIAIIFTRKAYSSTTALYILPVFWLLKNRADFFGLLVSKPFRMLGTCSFSIYLIHGITQAVSKHYLFSYHHYLWAIASLILTGVCAPVLYLYVEQRFMYRSKHRLMLLKQ